VARRRPSPLPPVIPLSFSRPCCRRGTLAAVPPPHSHLFSPPPTTRVRFSARLRRLCCGVAGGVPCAQLCLVRTAAPPSLTLGQTVEERRLSPRSHHDPQARPGARHGAEEGPASATSRASRRARAVHLLLPPRGVPAVLHSFILVRWTGAVAATQQLGAAGRSAPTPNRLQLGFGARTGAVAPAHQLGAAGRSGPTPRRRKLERATRTGAVARAQQLGAAGSLQPTESRRQLGRGTRTGAVVTRQQLGAAG